MAYHIIPPLHYTRHHRQTGIWTESQTAEVDCCMPLSPIGGQRHKKNVQC